MFRELQGAARRLGEVPAPARPHRRAVPAAGRPHRAPVRRPRRAARRPGPGGPRRAGQRRDPVRRRRRFGLRVVRGADDHGRGPQALPRQQLVGQGAAPAQGTAPAARRGDRRPVAAAGPCADRHRNSPPNWTWTATRSSRAWSRAAPTTRCRSTAAAAAATRTRLRSPTRWATSTSAWIRSRTEKRCGPCSKRCPSVSEPCCCCRFFESLTQTQIAERVGISQMHVSRLLAKSLARLRDQLQ